jgi:hypothetical protein
MDVNEALALTIPLNGIPANGLYKPPTNVTGFNTQSGENLDPPYNETLIGSTADNIVGTSTNPYLPAILPVYIPTLYANVYAIQTNLVDNLIEVSYDNDRRYPNAKAVKDYVASQLSGFENITSGKVSTSLTTTILETSTTPTVVVTDGISTSNHIYEINPIDNARNGAEKIVICNMALSRTATMSLVAGSNAVFAVLGKTYKYYQFAMQGDMIDMIQFINLSTGKNNFIVKTFGGVFSGEVV